MPSPSRNIIVMLLTDPARAGSNCNALELMIGGGKGNVQFIGGELVIGTQQADPPLAFTEIKRVLLLALVTFVGRTIPVSTGPTCTATPGIVLPLASTA